MLSPGYPFGAEMNNSRKTLALSLALTGLTCAALDAQAPCVRRLTGNSQPNTQFGAAIALIGDVTGDGVGDVAVGDPQPSVSGEVRVLSGADGSVVYVVPGPQVGSEFGAAIAGLADRDGDGQPDPGWGDVDGDNRPDFVVGAPKFDGVGAKNGGYIRLVSGKDGATLFEQQGGQGTNLGAAVSSAGNYAGAGPCFAAGAPSSSAGGVGVFDGRGNLIGSRLGATGKDSFGHSLALVGDANGDGRADLLVGSPRLGASPPGLGMVEVFADLTAPAVVRIVGTVPNAAFGECVGPAGDLDRDGRLDFLVTNRRDMVQSFRHNGAPLHVAGPAFGSGTSSSHVLRSPVGIGDYDGDGHDDYAFGALQTSLYNFQTGTVALVSGRTGATLRELADRNTNDFGAAIVAMHAGATPRLWIGSPTGSATVGKVHLVALDASSATRYGSPCSARPTMPSTRAGGMPSCLGETEFGVSFTGKPTCGNCASVLMIGAAQVNLPLPQTGGACTLLLQPLIFLTLGTGKADQFTRIPIPNDIALRGGVIFFQGVVVDPLAPWAPQIAMGDALRIRVR